MRHLFFVLALAGLGAAAAAQQAQFPLSANSLKFAVIGDNGTGERPQYEVGEQMATARRRLPFEFVLMLGDNLYGRQNPEDFVTKFERPYAALLKDGVNFYATLGNHDAPKPALDYKPFHMDGQRYYTFTRQNARFVIVDTNLLDNPQLAWLDDTLKGATEPWKIVSFHHPLYSNAGRHGSNAQLRVALEPILVKYGVNVVFSGHDHAYERVKPQKGITYFLEGSSGQLRRGDMTPTDETAASFDQDQTFMLLELGQDELTFQTVSRTGQIVDSGVIRRQP
jgi:predicted MPP superfamily phosphohydrolase